MTRPSVDRGDHLLPAVVVGAGLMGRWHARELQLSGGRLAGVCDRELPAAERLAARHPGARAEDDLDRLLAATAPAVVHVCTPPESHVAIVDRALKAGAHVLVEKPLAPDADATRRLLERAKAAGLLVCPVHQYLFQPGFARAEAALAAAGPLLAADALACSAGGAGLPSAGLERVVADIVPHPLAALQRLLPVGVDALGWSTAGHAGELRATAECGEGIVSLHVSMGGRPTRNEMRLIGRRGTVHLDFFHGYALVEPGGASRMHKVAHPFSAAARRAGSAATNLAQRAWRREPAYPGLRELIARFYAAASDGTGGPIPPADALAVARARDRLLERLIGPGAVDAEGASPAAR